MPKQALPVPTFDAQALIAKSQLRPGEKHALSVHVAGLEKTLRLRTEANIARIHEHQLEVCLNEDLSAFVFTFPGLTPHTVSWPCDYRPDLFVEWLRKVLRERRGAANLIGTKGAPTKADLEALRKASKAPTKKVGTVENLELEDLGL
jgi:hypothetical protein